MLKKKADLATSKREDATEVAGSSLPRLRTHQLQEASVTLFRTVRNWRSQQVRHEDETTGQATGCDEGLEEAAH